MTERMAPHSREAEEAVLGACLINPIALLDVRTILNREDFYVEKHGWIYMAMLTLMNKNIEIDMLTVSDQLDSDGKLDQIGGTSTLVNMTVEVPTSLHATHYANVVSSHAKRRRLLHAAGQIAAAAYDEKTEIDTVMDKAEAALFEVTADARGQEEGTAAEVMDSLYGHVEEVGKRRGVIGVPTGYSKMDNLLGGLHGGDMIILAARPSVGKTALALNVTMTAAKAGYRALFMSYEMSILQLGQRVAALQSGLSIHDIRRAELDEHQWPKLFRAMAEVSDMPIIFRWGGSQTPEAVRAKAKKVKAQVGLDLLIVDYIQQLDTVTREGSRQERVASISRDLKSLARELNVPLLALCQLSRALESRLDKRPILSDLRESGALEQDADVVAFIYRGEMYDENAPKGLTELNIAKHRNGPTGMAMIAMEHASNRFLDIVDRYDEGSGMTRQIPLAWDE